ncbi:Protein Mpv17 [Morella rubra]|uniref:Protein Mpv17 n=1 Tax=Morella rubra TaxID=262757 RepID=A0A6A1UJE6_9ROSI|nr:Protein Mpv17 [Morella rubra]
MFQNPVSLTRKSPVLHRFLGFSPGRISHSGRQTRILANPVQMSGFQSFPSWQCCANPLNSGRGAVFKNWGCSEMGLRQQGDARFRVFSVSNVGSANTGGYGGSGDGNSGGRGEGSGDGGFDGDGGNNWSLLSWIFGRAIITEPTIASDMSTEWKSPPDGEGKTSFWSFSGRKLLVIGMKYLALLAKYPVSTKALTSALLTLIGDLICQLVIDQVPSLDWKRTFLFTLLGLVLVGPTLHFWYLYLSRLVTLPGASGALLRLVLDQFVFSPIFIGVFLATLVTLEGRPSQVIPKLQQEWFSAVLANWKLWIPFQFLNFRFVPQQFQVLAANFIALVWNVVLSFIAHKEILPK